MSTRKFSTRAYFQVRTDGGGTEYRSFDAIAASAALQARLILSDRMSFEIAKARMRGELKTAEDVVLTLDQWWAMMLDARTRGTMNPRYQVEA